MLLTNNNKVPYLPNQTGQDLKQRTLIQLAGLVLVFSPSMLYKAPLLACFRSRIMLSKSINLMTFTVLILSSHCSARQFFWLKSKEMKMVKKYIPISKRTKCLFYQISRDSIRCALGFVCLFEFHMKFSYRFK